MRFIGIDPGRGGAIAVLEDNDTILSAPSVIATSVFSEEAYLQIISQSTIECLLAPFAVVEDVHAMPKQGVTSMFNFGQNKGWILGVLAANRIDVKLVSPQKWKKAFALDSDKQKSIACAKRLFPNVNLLATPRCRNPHDGIAEALLMAYYGRNSYYNTIPYP